MRCECVENRTHRRTHGQTKTQASTQTHIRGRLTEGPAPSSVVPVAGDLGHTAASSARHTAAQRRGGWGYGNRERLTGEKYIFFREEEKCERIQKTERGDINNKQRDNHPDSFIFQRLRKGILLVVPKINEAIK